MRADVRGGPTNSHRTRSARATLLNPAAERSSAAAAPVALVRPVVAAAIALALLFGALYVPAARGVIKLESDTIEFLDIARHLDAGEGYLLTIKEYYARSTPVVHNGLDERAPLYTFLLAALLHLDFDLYAIQLVNVL